MCCIIHRPKGAPQIKEEYIRSIIIWNGDGWGISYHNGNDIVISKSLDMKKVISKIRDLEKKDVEFLFHARYATHGKKDLINCHPYQVKPGVLFHNGTINTYIYDEDKSDTWHFAKLLNKRIKNSFMKM
ncbi:MAG: class II glutamine amidotransferase [Flavobacteriales bacterium]|nr:class II glutamine amidotransferase [Flavobacteriales bacterium]